MSKIKKESIVKHLSTKEGEEPKKNLLPEGEFFNCYTDNYFVHTIDERTYMTQWFVNTNFGVFERNRNNNLKLL